MSSNTSDEKVPAEWVIADYLIRGASDAKTLDHFIGWSDPNDFVQLFKYQGGYVAAKPRTKQKYYYSEITVDSEKLR